VAPSEIDNQSALRAAFYSVARCPNVKFCLESGPSTHDCSDIVQYQVRTQNVKSYEDFQLPEPWTGQIDRAPILFVSSNPSIGDDNHSLGSTLDDDVWDSRQFVFGGGMKPYTVGGKYTTLPNGRRSRKSVQTWAEVLNRAQELIPDRPVVPGIDYALTEVVHCKSRKNFGVDRALKTCTGLHFEAVMEVAVAPLVVVFGKARAWVRQRYGIPANAGLSQSTIGGRPRIVTFLGAPGGPEPRTFGAVYSAELKRLREAVQAHQVR
jgi:hypothetical protein